jgi:hypothetical protein
MDYHTSKWNDEFFLYKVRGYTLSNQKKGIDKCHTTYRQIKEASLQSCKEAFVYAIIFYLSITTFVTLVLPATVVCKKYTPAGKFVLPRRQGRVLVGNCFS